VLFLAAVGLVLVVAAAVWSQGQPAKQGPEPGRVKLIDTVSGNKNPIPLLAFTNGGKTLLSVSVDLGSTTRELEIKSWDVATRKVTATISQTEPSNGWAFSPDGNTVAVGLWNARGQPTAIRLYDLRQKSKPQDIKIDDESLLYAVAFSSDSKVLAWAGAPNSKKIRLWNLPAGKLIGTLTAKDDVQSLAFKPGGKSLVSAGSYSVSLWDVGTGNETKTFEVGKGKVFPRVAFSPDGKTLAVGALEARKQVDCEVKLWEVATGKNTKTLPSVYTPFAFNKDGKVFAACTRDGKVKLWNVTTGKDLITLALHDGGALCAAFSPDGRTLVTGGADKAIMWWELPPNPHSYPRLELQLAIPKWPGRSKRCGFLARVPLRSAKKAGAGDGLC
jgi:WD40 repeat protein